MYNGSNITTRKIEYQNGRRHGPSTLNRRPDQPNPGALSVIGYPIIFYIGQEEQLYEISHPIRSQAKAGSPVNSGVYTRRVQTLQSSFVEKYVYAIYIHTYLHNSSSRLQQAAVHPSRLALMPNNKMTRNGSRNGKFLIIWGKLYGFGSVVQMPNDRGQSKAWETHVGKRVFDLKQGPQAIVKL